MSIDDTEQKQSVLIEKMQDAKQTIIDNSLFDSKDKNLELNAIGEVVRGVTFSPSDIVSAESDNKVLILRANNIGSNIINYDDIIFVKKKRVSEIQVLKARDFAICMSSGSKTLLGKTAEYLEHSGREIAVGAFCSIYRLEKDSAYFDMVKYYFQSSIYRKQVSLLLSGSNINNLKKSDILGLCVPMASNMENEIAKLQKIDTKILFLYEQKKRLREIKTQIINQIFG